MLRQSPYSAQFPTLLWGIVCFFCLSFGESSFLLMSTFLLLILTFHVILFRENNWISGKPISFYLLLAFVFLQGVCIFFALSTKLAYLEYCKLLSSLSFALLLLSQKKTVTELLHILLLPVTLASFLSIDLIGTRWFSGLFQTIMGIFTSDYEALTGLETGVRINSILNMPNVFAGVAGIAVLFSLGMVLECKQTKMRCCYLFSLYWNSLAFVLVFSMGGTAMLALSFLLYLLLEKKKIPLLILMIETLLTVLFAVFPIFITSFQAWEKVNLLPLLLGTVGSLLFCGLHLLVGEKVSKISLEKKWNPLPFFLLVFTLVLVFSVTAFLWTGPLYISEGETVKRSAYPEAGDYALRVNSSAMLSVRIESQNLADAMQHTETILYNGEIAGDVTFTVPEDSIVVHFHFKGKSDGTIQSATLSNGDSLMLRQYLLPGFVTTRLQGLQANENLIQRLVFFQDGLTVWRDRPLLGSGLGAFESSLYRIQDFYYVTRFVHNHYIQILLEFGVIGLGLFLSFCGSLLFLLGKAYKKSTALTACSLTVFFFSLTHAAVEMTWSHGNFSLIMFLALAVFFLQTEENTSLEEEDCIEETAEETASSQKITEEIAEEIAEKTSHEKGKETKELPRNSRQSPTVGMPQIEFYTQSILLSFLFLFMLLQCAYFNANLLVRSDDAPEAFLKNVEIAIFLDPFTKDDHRLSYLSYVGNTTNDIWHMQAEAYISQLSPENSNVQAFYIAEYYLKQGNTKKAIDYLVLSGVNGGSHPNIWNSLFEMLLEQERKQEEILFSLALNAVYETMCAWDASHLGSAQLSEEVETYLVKKGIIL